MATIDISGQIKDSPQAAPLNFASKEIVGRNAHENLFVFVRFLPFIIGTRIPLSTPMWQILLNLKDIADLVAPVNIDETIHFLDNKISEYRHRFCEAFPNYTHSKASLHRTLSSVDKSFWSTCVLVDQVV